jgi:predicted DNA-binding transcriptional regulator
MNQNPLQINLSKIAGQEEFLSGNVLGRTVFHELQREVIAHPGVTIFCISLNGIKATDASFPRESVISLIKLMSGEKGFFLQDFASDDLLDNWRYAANAKNQSVIVRKDSKNFEVIGPDLHDGVMVLLRYVMQEGVVTTSRVAKEFDISASNASAKMKKLHQMGLVLASKENAETGGLEFVYTAIK